MVQMMSPGGDLPGARCGEYIGRGTVNYPCELPQFHQGPHAAIEIPSSMTARQAWEQEQQELATAAAAEAPAPQPQAPAQAPEQPAQQAPAPAAPPAEAPVQVVQDGASSSLPGLGDDLRSMLTGMHTRLDMLVNQNTITKRDGIWMLEATESLRDLFDKGWRG